MGVDRTIDITAEQRRTILALLERHLPGTAAWVYGSRAKWTSRPQSDLDLVVFATPEQRCRIGCLREAFEDSDLPFRVDLFVWDEVPETFREQIEAEHVVLVRSSPVSANAGWIKALWGDIATLEYGRTLREYHTDQGRFRVFGTNGPIGWHDRPLCENAGVIVGRKGAYRGVHYSSKPFYVIDTAFYLRPKQEIDVRWAYYELLTKDINAMDSGSAIPSTNREAFYRLPVFVPPLSEQRAIAHILGTLDDRIELNRRMIETLEVMARTLFKSWFVDFDPVHAEAEGHDPELPQSLVDLFPARFVDSDLGEIPEGWKAGTAADFSDLNPETWAKANRPAEIRYVDLSNTKRGRIEAITRYETAEAPSRAQRVLRPGDTIVGTVRPGNRSYALVSESGLTGSTGFAVLRPKAAECTEFVYLAATSATRIDDLAHLADGAAYPAVRPDVVAATPIVCPDRKVLARFSSSAGALLRGIAHRDKESRTLASVRDLLLPKLISGEIRLRDAEKTVEAVA